MKYNIIYADPPWNYRDKASAGERGAAFKYPTMSDHDIKNLPIKDIAADDCALFLWITFPKLDIALDVIKAWGFKYKTCAFTWVKTNKVNKNSLFWGMGNFTRSNAEVCLLATKGKPKRVSAAVHQVVMSPIGKHSKKPDEVRTRIEQLMGNVSRVELFSREIVPGWDALGNDIDGRDIRDTLQDILTDNCIP